MTDIAIRVDNLSKLYPARSLAVWRPGVEWAGHLGAAHLEPEILLVDEVLAVGDVAFQKKCRSW